MPRPPRIQFPGANYHIVTRGDGRRSLFHDERHYERFTTGLADEVIRSGWQVFSYCWMPNHIHVLLKTPEPNLSNGMQHWLSGYANWYAKRNQRSGHLFQGRYKAFLVEDEGYFWTLSRYIHLNPCVGKQPLCSNSADWPYSSYRGYARKSEREDFVDYDALLACWQAKYGGKGPAASYRRFVAKGLEGPIENPLKSALDQWVIGSKGFLKKMAALAEKQDPTQQGRIIRRTKAFTVDEIMESVATEHGVTVADYIGFRSNATGRDIAALLCRRFTSSTLAELSKAFGLKHPDSSANLVRRAKKRESQSKEFRKRVKRIEQQLG